MPAADSEPVIVLGQLGMSNDDDDRGRRSAPLLLLKREEEDAIEANPPLALAEAAEGLLEA